jgi:aldehyde:ferredoxin oxidoreductase
MQPSVMKIEWQLSKKKIEVKTLNCMYCVRRCQRAWAARFPEDYGSPRWEAGCGVVHEISYASCELA